MVPSRLIVVRGPSGSGKSTVACRLFEGAVRRVCLIEQDHYRFIFRPAGGGSLPNSATIHRMIEHNVMAALTDGYDVILEGILSVRSYGLVLDRLFSAGVSENFLYSFDISIEERFVDIALDPRPTVASPKTTCGTGIRTPTYGGTSLSA